MKVGGLELGTSFYIAPIVAAIIYVDIDAPNRREIYESFESMLVEMKVIVCARDPRF